MTRIFLLLVLAGIVLVGIVAGVEGAEGCSALVVMSSSGTLTLQNGLKVPTGFFMDELFVRVCV